LGNPCNFTGYTLIPNLWESDRDRIMQALLQTCGWSKPLKSAVSQPQAVRRVRSISARRLAARRRTRGITMADISQQDFTKNLFALLKETFEGPSPDSGSTYLEKGTGLFQTLEHFIA